MPQTKKVAGVPDRFRISSSLSVPSLGPSSKVRAMARRCREPRWTYGASKLDDRPRTAYASNADAAQAAPPRATPRIGENCITDLTAHDRRKGPLRPKLGFRGYSANSAFLVRLTAAFGPQDWNRGFMGVYP